MALAVAVTVGIERVTLEETTLVSVAVSVALATLVVLSVTWRRAIFAPWGMAIYYLVSFYCICIRQPTLTGLAAMACAKRAIASIEFITVLTNR